ncbi:MAG: DUF4202 domain-containing protein [Acidimicrobiia bacterium]
MSEDRLDRAIAAIDAANADDPVDIVVAGETRPKELAHAELVTHWVRQLDPDPSEALLLAARAHHLRRWTIPRASYPTGRAGYLKWRKTLHEQHASDVAVILADVGYDAPTVERVQDIVRKRRLGKDAEVQMLEDALCLVFIETQLTELVRKVDAEKLPGIIEKTAKKMSPRAIDLAMALDLTPDEKALLENALGG